MGLLIFLQVIFDLAFIATATLLLIERSKVRSSEDPRLSRGLQLLSSKIAILQDLMDRSETMSRQMTALIDGKQQDIQERLEDAEVHLHKIKQATEKSEKVARIFQDQIPHQEILQKQNTARYHEAAKLSNQGFSADDIAKRIDLPRGELDLIVKVNRHRLVTEKSEISAPPNEAGPEAAPEIVAVANAGNKEAHVRPFVFKRISNKITINEMDMQK
jgi:hypothetical protein